MEEIIKRESKEIDHKNFDAFFLVILSHGMQGVVSGTDSDTGPENNKVRAIPIDEITTAFDGVNCKSLEGKPKIFLIQACQGGTFMSLVPKFLLYVVAIDYCSPLLSACLVLIMYCF